MAFVSFKKEINRIYTKIDKIAKVGSDNYQEYYNYVDDLITSSQYGILTQVLLLKYDFDSDRYRSVTDVKSKSWKQICFRTASTFMVARQKLLKSKKVYQIGQMFYRESSIALVTITDPEEPPGSGAQFTYTVANDSNRGILKIGVLDQGYGYSTSSTIIISGGFPSAQALPTIKNGHVLEVLVTASGSNHNVNPALGTVEEKDFLIIPEYGIKYSDNKFEEQSDNKVTYLYVDKTGSTMSASFSTWDFTISYDSNLLNLYSEAIDYLL